MLKDEEANVEAPKTPGFRVFMTLVAEHSDGSKSWLDRISPFEVRPSERMLRSLIAGLLQTPLHECSTPSGFVPGTSPVTKIECSLEIVDYASTVPLPRDLGDTQFSLSDT